MTSFLSEYESLAGQVFLTQTPQSKSLWERFAVLGLLPPPEKIKSQDSCVRFPLQDCMIFWLRESDGVIPTVEAKVEPEVYLEWKNGLKTVSQIRTEHTFVPGIVGVNSISTGLKTQENVSYLVEIFQEDDVLKGIMPVSMLPEAFQRRVENELTYYSQLV